MTPHRRLHLVWPALALAMLSTSVPAAASEIRRVTLGNGLRVVMAPDSGAGTVDAALWYRCGTRNETTAQAGLALLAARLAFRNGATGNLLEPLEAEGGSGSLNVTPDYTSLVATVPSEGLGTALAFLAERLPGKPVTVAELAAERALVRGERARTERSAVTRSLALLWGAAWTGHAYARTGSPPASGDALTPADVEAWRKARYSAANAVLTLAGSFDPERTLAEVKAKFEAKPKGAAPKPAGQGTSASALKQAQRASERIESPARLCLVGWRGPGAGDPDAPALELLATCMGGGSQARLSRSLVADWNLALAAQAGFVAQQDGSLLWTLAVVPPGADSAAVERTLLDAARALGQREPEAFELERARRQLESAAWFGLQTARQRGQAVGEAEVLGGDAAIAARRLAALEQVTPADVKRVAARVMTDAGRATVWMLPAAGGGAR